MYNATSHILLHNFEPIKWRELYFINPTKLAYLIMKNVWNIFMLDNKYDIITLLNNR